VTGYEFDGRVLIPGRGRNASLRQRFKIGSGAHSTSYPTGYRSLRSVGHEASAREKKMS
jgi:hypothetical protein